ncbi:MAG: hypothetical protein Kow0077_03550 [Anaerolineae bacterium]
MRHKTLFLTVFIFAAIGAYAGLAVAQTAPQTHVAILVPDELSPDCTALIGDFHAALQSEAGPAVTVERRALIAADSSNDALIITIAACDIPTRSLRLVFTTPPPPQTTRPLSARLIRDLQTLPPLSIAIEAAAPDWSAGIQYAARILDLIGGQCADPDESAPTPPTATPTGLHFLAGQCLYRNGQYAEAAAQLIAHRPAGESGHDWRALSLWDATIADALAQSFAFDRALAWDDRNVLVVRTHARRSSTPLDTRLLAELYLLRGQHRLYLYEWDRVMADYDSAIGLAPELALGYYYRGILHATLNRPAAAIDDLNHFLQLEDDPGHPLVTLAQAYLAELAPLVDAPG